MKAFLSITLAAAALISPAAMADTVTWTSGSTDAATGNWNDLSFNSQGYTGLDTLVIDGVAKTITVDASVTAPAQTNVTSANAITITGGSIGGLLNKSGAGTLTLSSANSFGSVNVTSGVVSAGNANALGSGLVTLGDGTTLAVSVAGVTNTITVASGNTATFSLNNGLTFTGGFSGAGTVRLSASSFTDTRTFSAATDGSFTGTLLAARGNYNFTAANADYSHTGFGFYGTTATDISTYLNFTGAGTTKIKAITALVAGTVQIGGATTLDIVSGAITTATSSTAGTPQILGSAAGANLTSSSGILTVNTASGSAGIGGANLRLVDSSISTPLALVKSGANTLTLSGTNTYSGGTTLSLGTIALTNVSGLGTGALSFGSTAATLDTVGLTGSRTVSNNIRLGTGAIYTINTLGTAGAVLNFSGVISGGSSGATLYLNTSAQSSAGVITLSGNNTFVGAITLNRGSLTLNSATALGAITNTLKYDSYSGALAFGGSFTIANNINFTYAAQNIDTGSNSITLSGVIGGTNALTKIGTGSLTLSGNNTFSAGLTVSAGTVITSGISSLGSGAVTVASGGTLQIGAGGVTLGAGAGLTLASGGILRFTGSGNVIALNGTYSLSGIIDLNGGFAGSLGQQYTLITGQSGATDNAAIQNGAAGYSYSFSSGILTVTAVPEPATYGLLGAGALAAASLVRRRRKA